MGEPFFVSKFTCKNVFYHKKDVKPIDSAYICPLKS